jgi:hypothetical protein
MDFAAMAPIRETIQNGATRLVGVFKQKAQYKYQEACLKLETHARVFKVCHFPSLNIHTVSNH